jgi:hypothetical protein
MSCALVAGRRWNLARLARVRYSRGALTCYERRFVALRLAATFVRDYGKWHFLSKSRTIASAVYATSIAAQEAGRKPRCLLAPSSAAAGKIFMPLN